MKPKTVTPESELEERQKAFCDEVLFRAAKIMTEDSGAPMALVLDRILTFAAAHVCKIEGSPNTAKAFRVIAGKIEAGIFHSVTGESENMGVRH